MAAVSIVEGIVAIIAAVYCYKGWSYSTRGVSIIQGFLLIYNYRGIARTGLRWGF